MITNAEESAYRGVELVVDWYSNKDLELNVATTANKTTTNKNIDFWRNKTAISITPLRIREQHVELVWTHSSSWELPSLTP